MLALLAPDLHVLIDWSAPIVFLDKELQAVKRASAPAQGRRHADKLVQVQLLSGDRAPLLSLTRRLYSYGYKRDQIGQLLRLVEWVIGLPSELEVDYLLAAQQLEQEHTMSYVTIAERHGIAKGRQEGRQEGQAELLLNQIRRRFGPLSEAVTQRILTAKASQLETWSLNILDATELDDVFRG